VHSVTCDISPSSKLQPQGPASGEVSVVGRCPFSVRSHRSGPGCDPFDRRCVSVGGCGRLRPRLRPRHRDGAVGCPGLCDRSGQTTKAPGLGSRSCSITTRRRCCSKLRMMRRTSRSRSLRTMGNNVIVYSPSGVSGPGVSGAADAVYYQQNGSTWTAQQGPSCAGPWSVPGVAVANNPVVTASSPSGPLQLCLASGTITVHGSIEATYAATSPPSSRAVNIVQLSQYLDDVVPSESSPYWGTLGPADGPDPNHNPWGFQALEAQAVAARSYVLSTPNGYGTGGYADTCDQTCQSYPGPRTKTLFTTKLLPILPGG